MPLNNSFSIHRYRNRVMIMMSDKNITIDDVLEFIRKHGAVYDYRIYE